MAFKNKKKNVKDLDSVFQMLEKKEGIVETEEEIQAKKAKNKEMKLFRTILILLLIAIIILTVGFAVYSVLEEQSLGYGALKSKNRDDLIIQNVDETLLQNYLQPGKNTIVAFWASWCPYCRSESSELNKFMLENKNANIIVVSHDTNLENIVEYFEENQDYNWFIIYDKEKLIRKQVDPEGTTIPRTYLLNDKGEIIDKIVGEASYDALVSLYNQTEQ